MSRAKANKCKGTTKLGNKCKNKCKGDFCYLHTEVLIDNTVAKVPTKPVAKVPTKPVTKVPTKPIAKVPTKPVAKVPTKPPSISTFLNEEESSSINFFQKPNLVLVPTLHVHADLIEKSAIEKMFKIIDESDIIFFETSKTTSTPTPIHIDNEKLFKDSYTDDEIRLISQNISKHIKYKITLEELREKPIKILAVMQKHFIENETILDNVLKKYATEKHKPIIGMDDGVFIDMTVVLEILKHYMNSININPPTIHSILDIFSRMESGLKTYQRLFKHQESAYGKDVFDLAEKRNKSWKDTIQPYLDQGKKVAVVVGAFHIFAHQTLTLAKLFDAKYDVVL